MRGVNLVSVLIRECAAANTVEICLEKNFTYSAVRFDLVHKLR